MKRRMIFLLAAVLLLGQAKAEPVITQDTYRARHTEVDGQCVFELDGFTLDVYRADLSRDGVEIVLDAYPTGDWSGDIVPRVRVDGRDAQLDVEVQCVQGAKPVYCYTLTGPGWDGLPGAMDVIFPGDKALVKIRAKRFSFDQCAYYLEHEVEVAGGAYQALAGAQDILDAARGLLPRGAKLTDASLSEDRATLEYRLSGTTCLVDYFPDGHVEKAQRWDGDDDIVFSSTLEQQVHVRNIASRGGLGRAQSLRPPNTPLKGAIREDGLGFRLEGYHLEGDVLMVDWTASAQRPLYLQAGNLFLNGDSLEAYALPGDAWLYSLVPLTGQSGRYAYEGTSVVRLEDLLADQMDLALTLYFVEAVAPIVDWPVPPCENTPMLLDEGGRYAMIDQSLEEGGTACRALDELVQLTWQDEPGFVKACERLGFTRQVGQLTLQFTVSEPA